MHCKSYSHFFSKKYQHICVSLNVNFNESLTNNIVSFEQLGPDTHSSLDLCEVHPFDLVAHMSEAKEKRYLQPMSMGTKKMYKVSYVNIDKPVHTIFTLSIQTPQLLTILVLKFEQVV